MNQEDLAIVRAALFAWWNSEGEEEAPSKVDWNSVKDCWCDGWEAGYRAAKRFEAERLERADDALLIDGQADA